MNGYQEKAYLGTPYLVRTNYNGIKFIIMFCLETRHLWYLWS